MILDSLRAEKLSEKLKYLLETKNNPELSRQYGCLINIIVRRIS